MVGATLHCLLYNLLIDIVFPTYLVISWVKKISVKDMLNRKGLVALTEYQQVAWRLIKVENCNNKKLSKTWTAEFDFAF